MAYFLWPPCIGPTYLLYYDFVNSVEKTEIIGKMVSSHHGPTSFCPGFINRYFVFLTPYYLHVGYSAFLRFLWTNFDAVI